MDTTGDYVVAMKFKNGTSDDKFQPLKMFGQSNLTLPAMINALDVRSHSFQLCYTCNPRFPSGLLLTRPSTGASLATRLSTVDALSTTTARIHSYSDFNYWTMWSMCLVRRLSSTKTAFHSSVDIVASLVFAA